MTAGYAGYIAHGTGERVVWPDGSCDFRSHNVPGKWLAQWNDGNWLIGEDERTGVEVKWHFASLDEAAAALAEGGEGPATGSPSRR